jgi:ATP-dependent protease ClpP protease subunit
LIRLDLHPLIRPTAGGEVLDGPHIVRVTRFDDKGVRRFARDMDQALASGQPIIPVVVDSYGGDAYGLTAMLDTIDAARRSARIATIASGKAMSCGAYLFAAGDRGSRYVGPTATVMLHDMWEEGRALKVDELRATANEVARVQDLMLARLARECGRPKDYFRRLLHKHAHADVYLTPRQCLTHGIADVIGLPELRVTVSVAFDLNVPAPRSRPRTA